jgi:hypothetical protein
MSTVIPFDLDLQYFPPILCLDVWCMYIVQCCTGFVDHFSCNTRLKVLVDFMEWWLEAVNQNSGRLGQVITWEISLFPWTFFPFSWKIQIKSYGSLKSIFFFIQSARQTDLMEIMSNGWYILNPINPGKLYHSGNVIVYYMDPMIYLLKGYLSNWAHYYRVVRSKLMF